MEQKEEEREALIYWWCQVRDAVCIKENCAFWDNSSEQCIMQTIGRTLKYIHDDLVVIEINIGALTETM